jgi:hypothetical protein
MCSTFGFRQSARTRDAGAPSNNVVAPAGEFRLSSKSAAGAMPVSRKQCRCLVNFGLCLSFKTLAYGHLEKLLSLPIAKHPAVNVNESERERTGIICRQFYGVDGVAAIFRGALILVLKP